MLSSHIIGQNFGMISDAVRYNRAIRRSAMELAAVELRPDLSNDVWGILNLEVDLDSRFETMNTELEALRKRKRTLEMEVRRLTQALATGGNSRVPAAVISAINEREEELRSISDRLLQGNRDSIQAQVQNIREFVLPRLSDLRGLLYSDVPTAKAEILRHVNRIDLTPMEASGERYFVASGEWNLLGSFSSTKSVGAAGRKPTVLRLTLPFSVSLSK